MISFEEWCKAKEYDLERKEKKEASYPISTFEDGKFEGSLMDLLDVIKNRGYILKDSILHILYGCECTLIADWVEPESDYNYRIAQYRDEYEKEIKYAKDLLGVE